MLVHQYDAPGQSSVSS